MNKVSSNKLEILQEFDIACVIRNVKPRDILQAFVDHVCLYTSVSPRYSPGFKEVANTMGEFSASLNRTINAVTFASTDSHQHAIQCFREMLMLSLRTEMPESKKRRKAKPIVKRFAKILRSEKFVDKIYLDEENTLTVTDELNVICTIYGISIKEHLNYFMSQISLADVHARVGLKMPIESPAYGFFEMVSAKRFDLTRTSTVITDERMNFVDEVQELDVALFFVRDLEKRRNIYQRFFINYYQKLKSE